MKPHTIQLEHVTCHGTYSPAVKATLDNPPEYETFEVEAVYFGIHNIKPFLDSLPNAEDIFIHLEKECLKTYGK